MNTTKIIEKGYADVRLFNQLAGNLDVVTRDSIDSQISFIFEELVETINGFEKGDDVELLDGACDLFVTVAGLMQKLEAYGFDVATAIDRVNENNLSKFGKNVSTVDLLIDGYTFKLNEQHNRWVIKDRSGKVKKPSSFVPVDLSDLVRGVK